MFKNHPLFIEKLDSFLFSEPGVGPLTATMEAISEGGSGNICWSIFSLPSHWYCGVWMIPSDWWLPHYHWLVHMPTDPLFGLQTATIRDVKERMELMKICDPRWDSTYGAILKSSFETCSNGRDSKGFPAFSYIVAVNGSLCSNHLYESIMDRIREGELTQKRPLRITFAVPGLMSTSTVHVSWCLIFIVHFKLKFFVLNMYR